MFKPVCGSSSPWLLCTSDTAWSSCERLVALWNSKTFQALFILVYPSYGISHFSEKLWLLLAEKDTWQPRSESLMCSSVLGTSLLLGPLSGQPERNLCVCVRVLVHTRFHLHFTICIWQTPHFRADTFSSSPAARGPFQLVSLRVVTLSPSSRRAASCCRSLLPVGSASLSPRLLRERQRSIRHSTLIGKVVT